MPKDTLAMKPITRKEQYLAKINGEDVAIPEPITRIEHYLYEIAQKGGGGGTKDYNDLINKPTIEGQELSGNLTLDDIGDEPISDDEIIDAINEAFGL